MIEIIQQKNLLVGSEAAITELEKKEAARVILISDSHGNFQILKNIILQYGHECDAVIFCGDGLSDIAELLHLARESSSFAEVFPPVLAFVQGNCDPNHYPMKFPVSVINEAPSSDKKFYPLSAPAAQTLNVAGKKIYICHGHHEGIIFNLLPLALKAQENQCSCAVFGHSHLQYFSHKDELRLINPGSISRPRGNMPAGFAILTITQKVIDAAFLKTEKPYSNMPDFKVFNPIF